MNTHAITAHPRSPENLKANMKNHRQGFTSKVVAWVLAAITLGFSVQAFAVTRTCPVRGIIGPNNTRVSVPGVPGTGWNVLNARKNSRSKTEVALANQSTFASWFSQFIPAGTNASVTAYTYNQTGMGCERVTRFTWTVNGTAV